MTSVWVYPYGAALFTKWGAGLVVDACVLLLLHAVVRKGSPHRVRRGRGGRFVVVVVEAIVKLKGKGSGGKNGDIVI